MIRHFRILTVVITTLAGLAIHSPHAQAQQVLGAITGTVKDPSGSIVPDVSVRVRNTAINLTVDEQTKSNGLFLITNLPIGTYEVTFSKPGFSTESHREVLVQGDRTATVDGSLQVGTAATTVEVSGTPLRNQVDTTNGYIVDELTISRTPLGTGSFTQLAILSPGVSADFLNGSGTNAGLGNQSIFANGQRDSSNSFSVNGITTNNLFNGKSSSQVSANRFVLNTGESFGSSGEIQTSSSVYSAIGQSLPTPAPESLQEIRVDTSMYDASQGANSGAHIGLTTKSGTNEFHGQLYEYFQNNDLNAAPTFRNSDPSVSEADKVPRLDRNQFGATFGGPIIKNKLFFFTSYQGARILDQLNATQQITVPQFLTDDRSPAGLAAAANASFGTSITASQIDPVALKILQTKAPGGNYLIPSATIGADQASSLGYNAVVQGPSTTSDVDQGNADIDFVVSNADRLAVKYYIQNNPTTNPFSAQSNGLGFPQVLQSGAQVASIDNTLVLTPHLTWEQKIGFVRERAFATTSQFLSPADVGINLFGATKFPGITINNNDGTLGNGYSFGPSSNFANAGFFQNNWEYATNVGWQLGRHNITAGFSWDYTQMNVINQNNQVAQLSFDDFTTFLTGQVKSGISSVYFNGASNRYYRSNTASAFVNDNYRIASNLTLTVGLRYEYDGPLTEKYGNLTNFYGNTYAYDANSDTIVNSGLVFAGNNKQFHTPGVSDSTLKANQWGFAPRIGLAWSPTTKLTVRSGFGMYYDRGEFFSELSPSAGGGFNGPFGVTLQPPFVVPDVAQSGSVFSAPFGATAPGAPPATAAAFQSILPNIAALTSGNFPAGNQFGPYLFGGYDPANKLPYSLNWTLDLQYQPINNLLFDLSYVGNHGVHQVLPIPFNQAGIATPQHPINGQIYSYGFNANAYETITSTTGGNTDLRVPYIGYSPNSVFYEAEGTAHYNALQFQVRKRLSSGLQFTASYTWSHSLDEQSGLGLFYNGNDPLNPHSGYSSSDFDRTHVFVLNYLYQVPTVVKNNGFLAAITNGWFIAGQTIAQSGQPYNVYDFSGSIASIYYSNNDYITNPIVPLKAGVTASQAQTQGTLNPNPNRPLLDKNAFTIPTLTPGQDGVPPCDASGACDTYESAYGSGGRNIFRGPFQLRFDASVGKEFAVRERYRLRVSADFFNIFNHPSYDTPNNNVEFYNFNNPPDTNNPPRGSLGVIQHTIGSPRFIQLQAHLVF